MSVKHPALIAALMLGVSSAVLHSQGLVTPPDAPAAPAALFGAPAAPVGATAASVLGAGRVAAPPVTSGPFILDRPKPAEPAADAGAPAAAAAVDVSALRYYAHENDLARVAAEIRLLRAKHPGWEPPEDLFTEVKGSGESEQPLWDLFANHDLDGLKAAIAARRDRTPGWEPSSDLTGKLALAEAYDAMVKASDTSQWGSVIDIAAANRGLMTCGNVDALWRTADALVRTGDEARATEAYRYVLANCTKPAERLATMQKAAAGLKSAEAVDGLVRMGRRLPSGANEFDQVRLDGIRQKVGAQAAGQAGPVPTDEEIAALAASAHGAKGRTDAELLGWLALSKKDFGGAETWFRTALQAGPSPKGAEGLVLALRQGGKLPEAATLAVQYADLDHLNRKLMIEVLCAGLADAKAPPLAPGQDAALVAAIEAEKSADGAQSYGWARYRINDLAGAQAWFRKSAEWQPNEAAAIGEVVTAQRLKQRPEVVALMARYRAVYPKVAELEGVMRDAERHASAPKRSRVARRHRQPGGGGGWDQNATAIVKTFEGGNYEGALAMMDARRQAGHAEPQGLSVVRGWAMFKKGDWEGAKQVFTDVGAKGATRESMEGLRVIKEAYTPPRLR